MTFRLPILLSTLVWALQILAPLAHLHDDHAVPGGDADCHGCEQVAAGPGVEEACSPVGPCDTPGHHHHDSGHQHDSQCLVCKSLLTRLATEPSVEGLCQPWAIVFVDGRQDRVVDGPEQFVHPARGPPATVA